MDKELFHLECQVMQKIGYRQTNSEILHTSQSDWNSTFSLNPLHHYLSDIQRLNKCFLCLCPRLKHLLWINQTKWDYVFHNINSFWRSFPTFCQPTTGCHRTTPVTVCFTFIPSSPQCMQCIKSILNAMTHKWVPAPNKSRHQIARLINGALHLTWADGQIAICFTHTLYHLGNRISQRCLVLSF